MQLEESTSTELFLNSLQRLQTRRKEFDYILCGHSRNLQESSLCEAQLKAMEEVCNGMNASDEEYEWFGGKCMAHPYGETPRKIVYKMRAASK